MNTQIAIDFCNVTKEQYKEYEVHSSISNNKKNSNLVNSKGLSVVALCKNEFCSVFCENIRIPYKSSNTFDLRTDSQILKCPICLTNQVSPSTFGFKECSYEYKGKYLKKTLSSYKIKNYKEEGICFEKYREYDKEKCGRALWINLEVTTKPLSKELYLKEVIYIHNYLKAHSRIFFIFKKEDLPSFTYEFSYGRSLTQGHYGKVTFRLFEKKISLEAPFEIVSKSSPSLAITSVGQLARIINRIELEEQFIDFNYF